MKQRLLEHQQFTDENKLKVTEELIVLIKDWVQNHVIVEDKKYSISSHRRHQHGNTT
jgi:hemerythrin